MHPGVWGEKCGWIKLKGRMRRVETREERWGEPGEGMLLNTREAFFQVNFLSSSVKYPWGRVFWMPFWTVHSLFSSRDVLLRDIWPTWIPFALMVRERSVYFSHMEQINSALVLLHFFFFFFFHWTHTDTHPPTLPGWGTAWDSRPYHGSAIGGLMKGEGSVFWEGG